MDSTNFKPLDGIKVSLLTSGHKVLDHRIYDKEGSSLVEFGASVTIIGQGCDEKTATAKLQIVKTPVCRSRFERFLKQPWRCWSLVSRIDTNLIHIHDAELLQIVPWVRIRHPQIKVVYDVHEDFSKILKIRSYIPNYTRGVLSFIIDILEKFLSRFVHGIVGVTKQLTVKFSNDRQVAVYNFPSQNFWESAKKFSKPIFERNYDLVHLGTLSEKRAEFLVEILHILNLKRKGIRVLVTGVHDSILKYLRKVSPPGCKLEGQIPYDMVPIRLSDACVGLDVHPFPTDNLDVALPVKIFEYMACGCGIVASRLPILNELLVDNGISSSSLTLIENGTPELFANAIFEMIEGLKENSEKSNSPFPEVAKCFAWENEAKKLADFYLKILKC